MMYLDHMTSADVRHLERLAQRFTEQIQQEQNNWIYLSSGAEFARYIQRNIEAYQFGDVYAVRDNRLRGQIFGLALLTIPETTKLRTIEHAWISPDRDFIRTLNKINKQIANGDYPPSMPLEKIN